MKFTISGSAGFIGRKLSDYLLRSGNELIVISRNDLIEAGHQLTKIVNSADVIINLAGSTVLYRWNEKMNQKNVY